MKGIFNITKGTITLISIMAVIVFIGIGIAVFYYANINNAEDPRVIEAKKMYEKYDALVENNNSDEIFLLLDSIEDIYSQFDDYENSYEIGVLYNNRAAVNITQALYLVDDELKKDSLLNTAKQNIDISIKIFENWISQFGSMNENELSNNFKQFYTTNNSIFEENKVDKYLKKRVKDLKVAQTETPRRLSVSYTNLAIILRHQLLLDSSQNCYKIALDLWPQNITAENNLNILLGKPIRKRSIIERLFPGEKL